MTLGNSTHHTMALGFKGGSDLLRSTKDIRPHELYKGEELYSPSRYYQASEYFRKIHPEDFERMHHVHENLISGKLQHIKEEYRIITEVEGRKNNRLDGNQRSN